MTTLTVEIDKERDLPAIHSLLNGMGLHYKLNEVTDDWQGLSEAEIAGIKAGLEDIDAGRVYTYTEVKERIQQKISHLQGKHGN